jgi:hypothetical protein
MIRPEYWNELPSDIHEVFIQSIPDLEGKMTPEDVHELVCNCANQQHYDLVQHYYTSMTDAQLEALISHWIQELKLRVITLEDFLKEGPP